MRTDPATFKQLDLRVHTFLHDVPIHDVWRIELAPRDGSSDIQDVRKMFSDEFLKAQNPVVRGLFALRKFLGRLFGWDRERPNRIAESYARRLTEEDRAKSLETAGTPEGPFRVLYVFPTEVLAEAINSTVHAFSCMALVPRERGHFLYWAIYVRPRGPVSRLYMALIQPFRHWIVYPSILARAQRAWEQSSTSRSTREAR